MNNKQIELVEVTPFLAAKWLKPHYQAIANKQFSQRNISEAIIDKYAVDMKAGNWTETPIPIVMTKEKYVIDGQHRLEAVIKSGKTQKFLVYFDWEDSANNKLINAVDKGRLRSIANQFQIEGQTNANALVTSASHIAYIAFNGSRCVMTYGVTNHILNKLGFKHEIETLANILGPGQGKKFIGRLIGPLAWVRSFAKNKADDFLDNYINCSGEKNSPVSTFSKWERARQGSDKQLTLFYGLCNALRAHIEGRELTFIQHSKEAVEFLANKNQKAKLEIKSLTIVR